MVATVPSWIGSLSKLQSLILDIEGLAGQIPHDIGSLSLLRYLQLSGPNLMVQIPLSGTVPNSLQDCEQLESLDLERTSLNYFGSASKLLSFPRLVYFSLANSTDLIVPKAHLESLFNSAPKLAYIELTNVPVDFDLAVLFPLSSLTILDLSGTQVNYFLTSLFWKEMSSLKYLALANCPNLIGSISSEIARMTRLQHLDLSGSHIGGKIPSEIGSLPLVNLLMANTYVEKPFPESIHLLNGTLRRLVINGLPIGSQEIPDSWGYLFQLVELDLSGNGLNGTIPSVFGDSYTLHIVRLDNNLLTGHIPAFQNELMIIDLHNNRLTGTVSKRLFNSPYEINVSYNLLGPNLPDLITIDPLKAPHYIDFSHNLFSGPLPEIQIFGDQSTRIETLNFGFNHITGTIPSSYCKVSNLNLGHNNLTGPITDFSSQCTSLGSLILNHNDLTGTVPDLRNLTELREIDISDNHFAGPLPLLPASLKSFIGSNNNFETTSFKMWADHVSTGPLERLDISHNGLVIPFPFSILIGPNLTYLSLTGNEFSNIPDIGIFAPFKLTGLDLSNTNLFGRFRAELFPKLSYLNLELNQLQGPIALHKMPSLVDVNLAQNLFRFDAGTLPSLPQLVSINVRENLIYGSLVLNGLFNLQSADFSGNGLNYEPDLAAIGDLFSRYKLQLLNISDNPQLQPFTALDYSRTGLHRSSKSFASSHYPKQVKCYELTFNRTVDINLVFDEGLFGYLQCECSEGYFGAPPDQCLKCPINGASPCGPYNTTILPGSFAYIVNNGTSTSSTALPSSNSSFSSSIIQNLLDTLQEAVPILFSFGPPSMRSNMSAIVLQTESCLVTTVQTLSGRSNCKGTFISALSFNLPGFSLSNTLDAQCDEGSTGRLCSQCICEAHGNKTCWYPRGPTCAKCRRVFSLSTSFPVVAVLLLLSIAVTSVIMAIVLRRRRIQSRARFAELPLIKRIFYRVMYFKTLGNLPIMITFLQTLIAFTGWDASARLEFLNLLNGKSDGLGLRCLFPFLSDPLWSQIAELSVPFVLCCIVAISVLIGGFAARFKFNSSKASKSRLNSDFSGDELDKLMTTNDEILIEYPTMALLSSLVITVIKFFYFGTALAAHQYLFSSRQSYTGVKFIQYNPWMRSSEATTLIMASIPAILIFDLIIPLSFIFICWRVRNTFHLPSVRIYYGSIFETYRDRCFWWEIVNTLKKFSIAVVLKALPATDALQSALIVSIISGVLLIQLSIRPWKRDVENVFDSASALLLIGALLATRPSTLAHLLGVVWYMWVLSVLFVVASVGILIWQTMTGKTEYEKVLEEFEDRNMLDGHIHTIVDGNMTDSWNLMDSATNS